MVSSCVCVRSFVQRAVTMACGSQRLLRVFVCSEVGLVHAGGSKPTSICVFPLANMVNLRRVVTSVPSLTTGLAPKEEETKKKIPGQ